MPFFYQIYSKLNYCYFKISIVFYLFLPPAFLKRDTLLSSPLLYPLLSLLVVCEEEDDDDWLVGDKRENVRTLPVLDKEDVEDDERLVNRALGTTEGIPFDDLVE